MANDLLVKLGADVTDFQNSLGSLASQITNTISAINPVAAAVVGAVVGIGTAAVGVAQSWEDATHIIIQKTGETGDGLKDLKTDWEAVFKSGDEDAATVAGALSSVHVALGLTGEQLQTVSRNFLDLAGVTGEQVEPLIKATTQAFNDWKIAGDDVAKSQDFLLKVNQATGVSVTELSGQLAQSGPTLRQLGLDFETSAALVGKLSQVGPGASEAMSGLTKAVTNLTQSGIPAKDALTSIIESIKNAPSDTAAASEAMDIFGNRAGAKLSEQIRAGKFDLDGLVATLQSSTTTISDVDNATDGFGAKLGELWNNLQPLLVPLGTVLIDAASGLVVGFTETAKAVASGAVSFESLLTFVKPVTDFFINNLAPVLTTLGTLFIGLGVTIGQTLAPILVSLWSNVLVPMAGFIRDVVVGAFTLVTDAVGGFLGVLMSIPGVSALFENGQKAINAALSDGKTKTDDASKSAKDLGEAHGNLAETINKKSTPAITDIAGALKDANDKKELAKKATADLDSAESVLADGLKKVSLPVIKSIADSQADVDAARKKLKTSTDALTQSEADLKTKLANTSTSSKDLQASITALDTAKKNVKTSSDNLSKSEADLSASQKAAKETSAAIADAFRDLESAMKNVTVQVPSLTDSLGPDGLDAQLKAISVSMHNVQTDAYDSQAALRSMGITPKEDLQGLADKATAAFGTVTSTGTASAVEVREAHIKELEAIKAAYVASGTDLPAEQQKMLTALKAQEDAYQKGSSGPGGTWSTMAGEIQHSITDLSTNLVKSLFEDPGSFGKKALDGLKTIGESVLTAFITPATTAISGFVNSTLKDLLSGDISFGSIGKSLKDLGTQITGIFSGGSSVAGSAAGAASSVGSTAASAAGSAGSAASSAASSGSSAASGASSALGSVASVTGIVTGVISAGAGVYADAVLTNIKDCLNDMRNDTKYLSWNFDQGGLHGAILTQQEDIANFVNGAFGGWYHDYLVTQGDLAYDWADRSKDMALSLDHIDTYINQMSQVIPSKLDALANTQIIVNVKNYLNSTEISSTIQTDIEKAVLQAIA